MKLPSTNAPEKVQRSRGRTVPKSCHCRWYSPSPTLRSPTLCTNPRDNNQHQPAAGISCVFAQRRVKCKLTRAVLFPTFCASKFHVIPKSTWSMAQPLLNQVREAEGVPQGKGKGDLCSSLHQPWADGGADRAAFQPPREGPEKRLKGKNSQGSWKRKDIRQKDGRKQKTFGGSFNSWPESSKAISCKVPAF